MNADNSPNDHDAVDHDTIEQNLNEELVAYLDGELNRDSAARIEDELSTNEEYRLRLKQLQQAWDLMDELPREDVDETFTQSTVELVVVSAESEANSTMVREKSWRMAVWVLGLLGASAAVWGGFSLVNQVNDRDNQQLLDDLPLVQEIEVYNSIESMEFLMELNASGVFEEESDDAI